MRSARISLARDRLAVRQELSASLMAEFHAWLTIQRARLSRNHDLVKAINSMLRRWDAFTRFLDDGRVCLSNNAAERALRCVPLGRKAWLFCGSDRGGQRAAILYTLIQTARLNAVDPQAWLADVLARIADHPRHPARRTAAVELDASDPGREGRLMAARHFDVDIDLIEERAQDMVPEEAGPSVIDSLDDEAGSTIAFTRCGFDCLDEFLDQRRSDFMHES